MNSLRGTAVTAAMMLSVTIGAAAAAEAANGPREMLVGQYVCSTVPTFGPQTQGSLILSGTSGLFVSGRESESINVYADFEPGGLPVCDAFANEARARLAAVGCTASQISAFDPDPNNNFARRKVQFVCSGPRDKMVDSLARLVELIVTNGR